jgi:hypothetical protein
MRRPAAAIRGLAHVPQKRAPVRRGTCDRIWVSGADPVRPGHDVLWQDLIGRHDPIRIPLGAENRRDRRWSAIPGADPRLSEIIQKLQ